MNNETSIRLHAASPDMQFGVVPFVFREFAESLGEICGLPLTKVDISYEKPFYLVNLYTSFDGSGTTRPLHLVLSIKYSNNGKLISFCSFKKATSLGF
ncbi:hypothetical protein [Dipodfec virus UOA04_Rod_1038]|nr:hypothetical protein [Dipodfec virus UOA04_Rod_1038]